MVSVESQPAKIICDYKRVMSKKFSIKFASNGRVDNRLTVIFTSFLYSSTWGVTNIRLQQGCLGYSLLNPSTSDVCDKCDSDAFVISSETASRCQKCPVLCTSCNNTSCLTCLQGAAVNSSGLCSFGSSFKTQIVELGVGKKSCDGEIEIG